jgi:hypothetical protein
VLVTGVKEKKRKEKRGMGKVWQLYSRISKAERAEWENRFVKSQCHTNPLPLISRLCSIIPILPTW